MKRSADDQYALLLILRCFVYFFTGKPADNNGKDHQDHKKRFAPSIKEKACPEKEIVPEFSALAERIVINKYDQRQK